MDTATHIAMGVGLTALATQDPVMADTMVATATTLVAGSLIPDGDTVLKLKNNATYISHHRGITHSIPFTILWPILITFAIYIVFPHIDATHVWLWTQLAVFLHVFVDIFNSYGTQALRPITNKWIQLSVINTFDPIIFGILCLGIIIWALGVHPFLVFFPIIAIFIIYYIIRFKMQAIIRKQALKQIQQQHHPVKIFVAPTMKFMEWRVAIQTEEHDYVGRAYGRNVTFTDKVKRQKFSPDTILWQIKSNPDIRTFLNFSTIYRWQTRRLDDDTTEIRLIDLRYYNKGHYSFAAIAHLDKNNHIDHSYIGWVFTEDKLQKKLYVH
ncbi:metal-dependent hydrolase [Staphylococcus sp. NRL 16/872]|uniref:metal-dependent hydrolase n=1 Tax=Staphylococcus sp. NRL 16/872 TaxID=2930131 RepID=UPI001FB52FEA|nr:MULTISPECIES: metal-dependent hydrolase [unclassified Staphylococcus]MCJ1656032.1 metal-dependent hydrolase [Staphylococcus sp. NRL 21/187]MCJ1667774.1 metal-dependent hydrolase [Staphylococcus sp. NRL 19/737]WEN70264.1 metal-dependent hydrolase [Staphylococcus sp. NRL 16/872]